MWRLILGVVRVWRLLGKDATVSRHSATPHRHTRYTPFWTPFTVAWRCGAISPIKF
ncbi:MAG: hypothetical protein PUP92_00990 [Rhizonema sp. PD38]|nr:hypothetical protein [Rhizonema sp. PD38]